MNDTSTRQAAVSALHLSKSYRRGPEEVRVLQSLTFDVREGEFLALVGPSGSGKTTLLNILGGLDSPTSGTVRVCGTALESLSSSELTRWRAQHVGFIFQMYNLIPVLSALENVELPLTLTSMTRAERRRRAAVALESLGLADRLSHLPSQLSGGQLQRVAIARAIATDPDLIVADEPTGDLDGSARDGVLQILGDLNRQLNKTIVMVTHDAAAARAAHRVLNLSKSGRELAVSGEGLSPEAY